MFGLFRRNPRPIYRYTCACGQLGTAHPTQRRAAWDLGRHLTTSHPGHTGPAPADIARFTDPD